MSQRQEKDQVVEQATVGCDETAPPNVNPDDDDVKKKGPTKKKGKKKTKSKKKWDGDGDGEPTKKEKKKKRRTTKKKDIEDSMVPPSRDDEDDDLGHIKGARSRLELAPAVFNGDEDRKTDDETSKKPSKEKKTNDDKFEDGPKDYHQRTFRAVRAANMLLPDEESEDEEEEDEEDRPGAIPVRGIGRSGMGPSPDEEEVTIAYSMGGPNNGETAAEQDSGNALPSRTDEGNENLVEAVLAPEPPEIVVATPMEEEEDTHQETHHNRRRTYLLVAVISIAAVLALSLSLTVNGKDTEPSTETAPTVSPSTAPTNNKADTAISMLTPYIPDIPNSPMQLWALDWLINNDDGLIDAQDADRLLDRYVLAIFYNATNGDGWDENDFWLSELSVCAWDIHNGLLCPQIDGRAEKINWYENNLQGYIPTEIGALSTLTFLSLGWNDIQGSIPTEIGMLTELTILHLPVNELVGTIPTELGQLTELEYLYLNNNDLTGTIPTELDSFLSSLDWCRLGCIDGLVGIPTNCDRCW